MPPREVAPLRQIPEAKMASVAFRLRYAMELGNSYGAWVFGSALQPRACIGLQPNTVSYRSARAIQTLLNES